MNILEKICKEKKLEIVKLKNLIDYKDKITLKKRRGFIESLINKVSNDRIESQDESEGILDSNIPVEITGELDFQKLIGVVVQGRLSNKINRRLKMRRIEL